MKEEKKGEGKRGRGGGEKVVFLSSLFPFSLLKHAFFHLSSFFLLARL